MRLVVDVDDEVVREVLSDDANVNRVDLDERVEDALRLWLALENPAEMLEDEP